MHDRTMSANIIYLILFFNTSFIKSICGWINPDENYTIYQVTAFNSRERSVLYRMQVKHDYFIFLNSVTNEASVPMTVIAKQSYKEYLENTMQVNNIEYIKINRESVLKEFNTFTYKYFMDRNYVYERSPKLNERFLDYVHMITWINNRLKKYGTVAQKIVIGDTFEKREMFVLKISTGIVKPAVVILGGEQGRDWISPAIILSFIDSLLLNRYVKILDIYDVYLLPIFNPDGYEYSMKMDRFWIKNRDVFFPHILCQNDEIAVGVNIDRNFFLNASTYSVSVPYTECDSVYTGHKTITEEEPKALVRFLNTIAANTMAFINVRGFSNVITVPYATNNEIANNYAILMEMLLHACDKVYDKYNVSYNLCTTGSCFYNFSGNSPDWVKNYMNVPIVYTIYMSHKDSFLPRVDQVPSLTEHFGLIIQETLLLANSIYGPLFNSVYKLSSSIVIALTTIYHVMNLKMYLPNT